MTQFDAGAVGVGDALPPLDLHVTRATLVRYAGASTDFNPIHYSDRKARELGLDGVIAHGMLTMGSALRIVTDWIGDPAAVRSYYVRFVRPVAVPDDDDGATVHVTATVSSIDQGVATIALTVIAGGTKVLGSATVEATLG